MGVIDRIWWGILTYWAAIWWMVILILAVSTFFIVLFAIRQAKEHYDEDTKDDNETGT